MDRLHAPSLRNRRFQALRCIAALMLREMSTGFGRSPGGYLWAIVEPVAGITLLSLAFSLAFQAPAMGTSFALFYASGFLPFTIYTEISRKVAQSLNFSKALLFYPAVNFMDAIVARFAVTLITQLLVFILIVTGIQYLFPDRTTFNIPAIVLALALCAALGLGIGIMNCMLSAFFPTWDWIWAILNRPLFLVCTIFFTYDSVPLPWRDWLWYNPIVHLVGEMRKGFYPYYQADYVSVVYVLIWTAVPAAIGLYFLGARHRKVLGEG